MNLKTLCEQARYLITGGSPTRDTNFEFQDLIQYAKQLLAVYVKKNLFENKQDGISDVDGQFVFTFENVPVAYDSSRNKYYSDLPSSYVTLPHEAGVDSVSLMKGDDRNFIKVGRNFTTTAKGLMIEELEDNFGYWTEGTKIYYSNFSGIVPTEVRIKLIAGLDSIDDTTQIGLPTDGQQFIVDGLVQRFETEYKLPPDKLDDNRIAPTNPPIS